MRARYVIETASWPLMAQESNFGNAHELFAIGISAARGGNQVLAERARQALGERAKDPREGDLLPAIAIMEREVAAIIALGAGRRDEAVDILRAAAEAEASCRRRSACPAPVKPAPELLGEVLIEVGRPAEAVAAFDAALRRIREPLGLGPRSRARNRGGRPGRHVAPPLSARCSRTSSRRRRPARAEGSARDGQAGQTLSRAKLAYCGRLNSPPYTALPRMCPWIAFITFARVSNASALGCTSIFVSRA